MPEEQHNLPILQGYAAELSLRESLGQDVTALKVEGSEDEGSIEFFEKKENTFESKGASYYLRFFVILKVVLGDIDKSQESLNTLKSGENYG